MSDLNAAPKTAAEAMAREYPPCAPSPCVECPWRRVHAPGWLGPMTAEEWLLSAHGETPIACHRTIPKGGGWGPKTIQCRGAAIFRANVLKTPRNRTIETGPRDTVTVFETDDEFLAHHTGEARMIREAIEDARRR